MKRKNWKWKLFSEREKKIESQNKKKKNQNSLFCFFSIFMIEWWNTIWKKNWIKETQSIWMNEWMDEWTEEIFFSHGFNESFSSIQKFQQFSTRKIQNSKEFSIDSNPIQSKFKKIPIFILFGWVKNPRNFENFLQMKKFWENWKLKETFISMKKKINSVCFDSNLRNDLHSFSDYWFN